MACQVTCVVDALQAGVIEDEMDSLLHKRLNAGLSTFCIAQALLLVSWGGVGWCCCCCCCW
jgi:hypothetical protein